MYTGLGVYFIQTKEPVGALMRWMWGVDYDVLAFQLPSGPHWLLYFIDLTTMQSPSWAVNGLRAALFVPDPTIIIQMQWRAVVTNHKISSEMAKFVLVTCMFERSPEERQFIKQAHWRTVLEERWHPERSLAVLQDIHFSTQEWIDLPRVPASAMPETTEFIHALSRHATCNANAVPIEVLQRNTRDVLEVLDTAGHVIGDQLKPLFHTPASPLPANLLLTTTDHVRAFEQATQECLTTIQHGGTALIHLNPLIQAVRRLCPGTALRPPDDTAPTSYPALLLLLPLDHPTTVRLPSLSLSEPVYVSLMNPDLSMMTTSQLVELTELLNSADYFTNPVYDALREMTKTKLQKKE